MPGFLKLRHLDQYRFSAVASCSRFASLHSIGLRILSCIGQSKNVWPLSPAVLRSLAARLALEPSLKLPHRCIRRIFQSTQRDARCWLFTPHQPRNRANRGKSKLINAKNDIGHFIPAISTADRYLNSFVIDEEDRSIATKLRVVQHYDVAQTISAKRHNVCECCLGSGIRAGLDHAVVSHEEFGAWIGGKAIE